MITTPKKIIEASGLSYGEIKSIQYNASLEELKEEEKKKK